MGQNAERVDKGNKSKQLKIEGNLMAFIDERFETKKAIFYSDKIVLKKKKGDITIDYQEIDKLVYARPTMSNYIFAQMNQIFPGQLAIWLKKPLKEGKKAGYVLWIKYKNFLRIPQPIRFLTELH